MKLSFVIKRAFEIITSVIVMGAICILVYREFIPNPQNKFLRGQKLRFNNGGIEALIIEEPSVGFLQPKNYTIKYFDKNNSLCIEYLTEQEIEALILNK